MFLSKNSDPKESLEGLFTIVMGQYAKRGTKADARGEEVWLGGYDPENSDTVEWYRVMDTVVWNTVYCGSSLDAALRAVRDTVRLWRDRRNYFKHVCRTTTEDYYEVHYLHHAPLTVEEREKKRQEGKAPRPSDKTKLIDSLAHEEYGWYFEERVREAEREGMDIVKRKDPAAALRKRAVRIHRKVSVGGMDMERESVTQPDSGRSASSGKLKVRRVKTVKL